LKIICIGRNYVKHIDELKNEIPDEPVFFLKPDTALMQGNTFYLPDFSKDIHHEIELVLKINKEGKNISKEFASRYYNQISVGLDFTARDIQEKQKAKGLPWEPAKAFDNSSPIGEFISIEEIDKSHIAFHLRKNGTTVQEGNSQMMINSFDTIINYVSKFITLRKGDLIYTGTPAGVSQIHAGDLLECFLEDKNLLKVFVK
jgi:acylpyruvate hydrolase